MLSGLFFGLIGYFGMSAMNANLSVYTMLFWRFTVSSLFILIMLLPQIKILTFKPIELLKVFFYGVTFYSTSSIFYFLASYHIGSGLAMVIFFTYPAIVMFIYMVFYRTKPSKIYIVALMVIIAGMLLLMNGNYGALNATGIEYSIFAALAYALYVIVSKHSPIAPLPSTLILSLGCIITCWIASMIDNSFSLPVNFSMWSNIVGIGVICTALPIVFLLKGLKNLSATQASILSVFEPIFVVIFGIILLDEKINLYQTIGVITLLCGALISLLNEKFTRIKEPSEAISLRD
jgi:drug/metabolite transporter (DMT)-like permease